MSEASTLWRRLDVPGHDTCRLRAIAGGWQLQGAAVFREAGVDAALFYELDADSVWRTRAGRVHGWLGERALDLQIERDHDGDWFLDGARFPQLRDCTDLDFGFTPSTNLFQLRRVALEVGESADVNVAWLDVFATTLDVLQQRYERRSVQSYWYDAPRFDYHALLEMGEQDFVRVYPGLWVAEH